MFGFLDNDTVNAVDPFGLDGYFFDGTENDGDRDKPDDPNAPNGPTNVKILYDIYLQAKWYMWGVGTRESTDFKRNLGLAFGYGANSRVEDMMGHLDAQVAGGTACDIDVFGFSRGAAEAREFVYRVGQKYPRLRIRFLGIFDSVLSTPNPGDYHLRTPRNVQTIVHPTAKGERRYFFPLSSIRGGPNARMGEPDWWEFSLPGAHSDVGGGYKERRQFANRSLQIMHEQAVARGVPLGEIPPEYLDVNIDGLKPHDSRWPNDMIRDTYDWLHKNPLRPREIIYYP